MIWTYLVCCVESENQENPQKSSLIIYRLHFSEMCGPCCLQPLRLIYYSCTKRQHLIKLRCE